MLWMFFALKFICLLRFPKNTPVTTVISRRYGHPVLRNFRLWERSWRRLEKTKQDLDFLERCILFNVTPKFLRFRLYNRNLEGHRFYREWQQDLLHKEITVKQQQIKRLCDERLNLGLSLKNTVSFLDFNFLLHYLNRSITKYLLKIRETHANKLFRLGASQKNYYYPTNKVVTNLSHYNLTKDEINILALGLEHNITPNLSKLNYFSSMEQLYSRIKEEQLFNIGTPEFREIIKTTSHEIFNKAKNKRKTCVLKKEDIEILRKLGKNENIHLTRPDKGRGIVLLDRVDYVNKMEILLSNHLIFENRPHDNPIHTILKVEDRVNRLLKKMKENANITENEYKQLYATGSSPNILYGLPKTHKQNYPMRPIVSSYNAPQYKLSKFVISEISHLADNEYVLKKFSTASRIFEKCQHNKHILFSEF